MKILAINCTPDLSYFKTRGLDFEVEYKTINELFPLKYLYEISNQAGQIVKCYTPFPHDYLENLYKTYQYSFILIGFDPKQYSADVANTGGYSYFNPLSCGTFWATVRKDPAVNSYIVHELHHLLCLYINIKLGNRIPIDYMDSTPVDGQWRPYYLDNTPEDPKSNHAQTWRNIEPWLPKLKAITYGTPPPPLIQPQRTLKLGMMGADVKALQNDLKSLKYLSIPLTTTYFGILTLGAVKSLQRANWLVSDGVVGQSTFAKIEELKKKPVVTGKDWRLLPLVQRKADIFIAKCKERGLFIKIVSAYRGETEQNEKYAQGRTTPGSIITNAPYPKSLHNHGMAFDVCFVGNDPYPTDDTKWKKIVEIAKPIGLTAGYNFTSFQDKPHFEFKGKYSYDQIANFDYKKEGFN